MMTGSTQLIPHTAVYVTVDLATPRTIATRADSQRAYYIGKGLFHG